MKPKKLREVALSTNKSIRIIEGRLTQRLYNEARFTFLDPMLSYCKKDTQTLAQLITCRTEEELRESPYLKKYADFMQRNHDYYVGYVSLILVEYLLEEAYDYDSKDN